jgi:hypothetical protein
MHERFFISTQFLVRASHINKRAKSAQKCANRARIEGNRTKERRKRALRAGTAREVRNRVALFPNKVRLARRLRELYSVKNEVF